jgi:hypothetical protein
MCWIIATQAGTQGLGCVTVVAEQAWVKTGDYFAGQLPKYGGVLSNISYAVVVES